MPIELGPDYALAKMLSSMEARITGLENRDVLRNAAITAGGLTISGDGSLKIEGTGAAYVNGLKLSSVVPGSVGGSTGNWAIPSTSTPVCTLTVTVPDGYGTALVMCVCQINAFNLSGGNTYIFGAASINGTPGAESNLFLTAATGGTMTPAAIRTINTSSLSSFEVGVNVRSPAGLSAAASNVATVNAIVVFTA